MDINWIVQAEILTSSIKYVISMFAWIISFTDASKMYLLTDMPKPTEIQ